MNATPLRVEELQYHPGYSEYKYALDVVHGEYTITIRLWFAYDWHLQVQGPYGGFKEHHSLSIEKLIKKFLK
jgi:hypothetical protein